MIAWCESLPVPSGRLVGQSMRLQPFQRRFVRRTYRPGVRLAVLSMPRKNGKTGLCAALLLGHLCGPMAIPAGEGYAAASDGDQAALVWRAACGAIDRMPWLQARLVVRHHERTITDTPTGTRFAVLSAIAATKHGLSPSIVIYDELGQARNRELFDALATAGGARDESLMVVISTQAEDDDHVMSEQVDYARRIAAGEIADPTFVGQVYAAPDDADPWSRRVWRAANPGLGAIRSLDEMAALARRAQAMPGMQASFRRFYLNQRRPAVDAGEWRATWVSRELWEAAAAGVEPLAGRDVVGAVDLRPTDYLAVAAVAARREEWDAQIWVWVPADRLAELEERDGMAPHYQRWHAAGHLRTLPGRVIRYPAAAAAIAAVVAPTRCRRLACAPDRLALLREELPRFDLVAHGQRYGAPPRQDRAKATGRPLRMPTSISAVEELLLERRLHVAANPVLTWSVGTAAVTARPSDPTERRFQHSPRPRPIVALTMAVGAAAAMGEPRASTPADFILRELY